MVITDTGECQIWLAATERDKAVDCVLDAVPEGGALSAVQREVGRGGFEHEVREVRHPQLS